MFRDRPFQPFGRRETREALIEAGPSMIRERLLAGPVEIPGGAVNAERGVAYCASGKLLRRFKGRTDGDVGVAFGEICVRCREYGVPAMDAYAFT